VDVVALDSSTGDVEREHYCLYNVYVLKVLYDECRLVETHVTMQVNAIGIVTRQCGRGCRQRLKAPYGLTP
jgi:hypothetical protein